MYSNPINSQQDAFDLVRRYRLDQFDLGGGSTEGFAAWLFERGSEMWDLRCIADAIETYRKLFSTSEDSNVAMDQQFIEGAENTAANLRIRIEERAKLAAYIRSVQWSRNGGAIWSAVAELATTPESGWPRLIHGWSGELVEGVYRALSGLQDLKGYLGDSSAGDYVPGANKILDYLVRQDLERFEVTLDKAAPWAGKEDEQSLEKLALHNLVTGDVLRQLSTPARTAGPVRVPTRGRQSRA